MRDWNGIKASSIPLIFSCELNLWGIETAYLALKKITAAECELNLWGIETRADQEAHAPYKPCELNLWGIETKKIKEG